MVKLLAFLCIRRVLVSYLDPNKLSWRIRWDYSECSDKWQYNTSK